MAALMARHWTCGGCKTQHPRTKQKCACGRKRPAKRVPAHRAVLDSMPYEEWVERFGDACNICGASASATRRLDRDHCHKSGQARGLLCHLCNRNLGNRVDSSWLERAAAYLRRTEVDA